MDPVAAVAVVSGAGHVIELPDAGHHRSWIPLGLGLASRLQQGLDTPSQHLLSVEVWAFDVVNESYFSGSI